MKYAKVQNGQVLTKPKSSKQVMIELNLTLSRGTSQIDMEKTFAEFGYLPVPHGPEPKVPDSIYGRCIVSLGVPTLNIDGTLTRTYEFTEAPPEVVEAAKQAVRAKRDYILSTEVDSINAVRWANMTIVEKAKWGAYRKALLDFPQAPGFPLNAQWPRHPKDISDAAVVFPDGTNGASVTASGTTPVATPAPAPAV